MAFNTAVISITSNRFQWKVDKQIQQITELNKFYVHKYSIIYSINSINNIKLIHQ